MFWNRIFATKSLEMLDAEAKGDNRLRRVLGPIQLTSLGVGAIIGAGIFVMTGEVASNDAGPSVVLSYVVAGIACALAAFCYSEFASMAPVAGSAYTYAYATLGEIFAWIIGWDLILEYAMAAAVVAAVWAKYLNKFLKETGLPEVPAYLCNEPFSNPGAIMNLPGALILIACTVILVIGIRESAATNTAMVLVKLAVVVFVIIAGLAYIKTENWFDIPAEARKTPEQILLEKAATKYAKVEAALLEASRQYAKQFADGELKQVSIEVKDEPTMSLATRPEKKDKDGNVIPREKVIMDQSKALLLTRLAADHKGTRYWDKLYEKHKDNLPTSKEDIAIAEAVLAKAKDKDDVKEMTIEKWGMIAEIGINETLEKVDDQARGNYLPYGISGIMLGAALVFFAFIGFDAVSTHSEEAIKPQRDVPIGILASLAICTLLYVGVSAVITGMVPYPDIDTHAAVASAFTDQPQDEGSSWFRSFAGILIALGALAGMTSVLLITFLSQARIFLAMARDGLMPQSIFGVVHEKFKTPYISTIVTGLLMALVAAFTPIADLEKMVNIGTLFAFVVVCAAVLILRIKRPEAPRPFRCPAVFVVAPLGIAINVLLMLFLPVMTWARLFVWLGVGMCIYFGYGYWNSVMRHARPQD
jgi:amino acid transporter